MRFPGEWDDRRNLAAGAELRLADGRAPPPVSEDVRLERDQALSAGGKGLPAAALILPLLLALLGGCGRAASRPTGWNVVMVLVDTLRADHLSVHGYERPTSSYLEEFARSPVAWKWTSAGNQQRP